MKIFDLHNDCITSLKYCDKYYKKQDKETFIVSAIYKGDLTFNNVLQLAQKYANTINTKIAFEDIGYSNLDIEKIIKLQPLYASLTYNDENDLGFGVNYTYPLKTEGVKIAKKLYENNIAVDTAHLSIRGIYSLLENNIKILNSHTAIYDVYNHKRNLPKQVIKDIVKNNGIIAITLVGYFLGEYKVNIYDYFKHIDFFVQHFGDDNIAIGSDFNGSDYFPKGLKKYFDFNNLIKILKGAGYSDNTIKKIFYINAEKYFNR